MRLFFSARGAVVEAEARGIMATAHVAHVRGHCFQSVSFAVASVQCHCLIVVVQVFDHWSNVTHWQNTLMGKMFGNIDSWLIT